MSRRFRFFSIILIAAIGTSLAAVGGWRYARASAPVNGPIILISIDTLRADRLSAYGYRDGRTPAIDALAADGIVFDRAYTHAAETLPAHVAMLSGRLPFETGVRGDDGHVGKQERLLARMLHDRGYATGGIVSTTILGRESGIADGFDFFDAAAPPADALDAPASGRRSGIDSELVAEHWLDLQGSSRVFLFLQLYDPHRPYPPAEDADTAARYDAQIARADAAIGALVRWLKQHQLYDRSTIVFTADHGEGLGDHGEQEHGLFAYDETIHVPLIVKQASAGTAGRHVSTPVQLVDLVPTVLDLVKAPVPNGLRGRSLKPVLEGEPTLPHQPIYSEARYGRRMFGWAPIATVTDGRFRYISAPRDELYDMTADPGERQNIVASRPDAAAPLRDALKALVPPRKAASTDPPLTDPKDGVQIAEAYRQDVELAVEGRVTDAIAGLRRLVDEDPKISAAWREIAVLSARAGQYAEASDAYEHLVELEPDDAGAHVGAGKVLLTLRRADEARAEAERGLELAGERGRARLDARLLLAAIALDAGDAEAAREQAAAIAKLDPTLPIGSYVEARLAYYGGDYEAAAAEFERASAGARTADRPLADLHYYAGDTFVRLERYPEAEAEFVEELRTFPRNTAARAALASLYHATSRPDEAARVLREMLTLTPTADTYAQVARLWTSFGDRQEADAVRAEAKRAFPPAKPSARH